MDRFRIITLAQNLPGPIACQRLQAMGARILKIEPPAGDPLQRICPAWYREMTDGQEVERYDLRDLSVRGPLEDRFARSHLLITSMRPAALRRAGLDPERLRLRWPALSLLEIVGHPESEGGRTGHDLTYLAEAGLLRPPHLPTTLWADVLGAERVVSSALQLLWAGERDGVGRHQQVALISVAREAAAPLDRGLTGEGAPLGGGDPLYGLYRTAEGWIAVAALEAHFRERLLSDLSCAPTRDALGESFLKRTASEWEAWATERELPVSRVLSAGEV